MTLCGYIISEHTGKSYQATIGMAIIYTIPHATSYAMSTVDECVLVLNSMMDEGLFGFNNANIALYIPLIHSDSLLSAGTELHFGGVSAGL